MCSSDVQIRWKFVPAAKAASTEELKKKVYDTFDEFQSSILKEDILHPSEECHRQIWFHHDSKLFDIINSYHIFCKLCKKHFYSRSVPTDVNSFFQHHVNSEYHREFRDSEFSHMTDMIIWEKQWKTGRCNLCQISGMVAYVTEEGKCVMDIYNQHYCVWNFSVQEKNQEFLKKMSFLVNYCKLSVFREKFIKPLNNGSVCLLCSFEIPWTGENVKAHLGSPSHLNLFRSLIWKRHKLSLPDLLNGFNLEAITRWIHSCILNSPGKAETPLPNYKSFKEKCAFSSLTPDWLPDSGISFYCPLEVEKLIEPWNFPGEELCHLCDQPMKYDQFEPGNMSAESSNDLDPYKHFCKHFKERLRNASQIIEKYKNLVEGKNHLSLKVEAKYADQGYVKALFFKKLRLVKAHRIFPNQDFYCNACDMLLPATMALGHLTDFNHVFHCKKWMALEKEAATDAQFFDSFQKVENQIICLLCGAITQVSNFFNHLKSSLHAQRFEWYSTLKNEVPISLAIRLRPDMSIVCYLCDRIILNQTDRYKFQETLNVLENHWPCPSVKKQKNCSEDKSFKASNNTTTTCSTCEGNQESHSENCPTNSLNFKNVENAVECIMVASEDVIFKTVLNKTQVIVSELESATAESDKQQQEAKCDCGKLLGLCSCGIVNGELKTGDNKKDLVGKPKQNEREILVISGLEKCRKKVEFLSKLQKIKKIHSIRYLENSIEILFVRPGVAKAIAECELFRKEYPFLTVAVESKPSKINEAEENSDSVWENQTFPPMPFELVEILQEPPKLLSFIVDLTAAATAAAESVFELERERRVCSTIIAAASELFPDCMCYPFGSRLSGLMFQNSDLDVFLDCGGMYKGSVSTSPRIERKLIHNLAEVLRKKPEVSNILIIDRARVPIISFYHKLASLHCDVSIKNALSVHNTLLIRFLVSLDYEIKFVIMFLKYWVKKNKMHGPPFFSSYAITMMAIFYLQQLTPPLVPTIEKLQTAFVGQRLTIGGWDCSFSENREIFKSEGYIPFHVILRGFFCYYAEFDFVKFVISPLDGKPLPREAFWPNSEVQLPMSYKRHILNFPLPLEKLVCQSIPLCILDPFDLSHVLTKSFTETGLEMFKYYCQLSSEALNKGIVTLMCSN